MTIPAVANYADYQLGIYLAGLNGARPELPFTYAEWERRAAEAMDEPLWDYVAGGSGDEHTQRGNVAAF